MLPRVGFETDDQKGKIGECVRRSREGHCLRVVNGSERSRRLGPRYCRSRAWVIHFVQRLNWLVSLG